jgi:hypothetical protein
MQESNGANVIGEGCRIDETALVRSSILGRDVILAEDCVVRGAIVWDSAVVGRGAIIDEGCIIGPNCVISDGVTVTAGTVLDEGSVTVSRSTVSNENIEWSKLNFDDSVLHLPKISEANEKMFFQLGLAISSACPDNCNVGIMSCGNSDIREILHHISLGIRRGGGVVFDEGEGFAALAAFAARERMYDLMIFAEVIPHDIVQNENNAAYTLKLYDCWGMYPSTEFERKLTASMRKQKVRRNSDSMELCVTGDVGQLFVTHLGNLLNGLSLNTVATPSIHFTSENNNSDFHADMEQGIFDFPLPTILRVSLLCNPPSRLLGSALQDAGAVVAPGGDYKIQLSNDGFEVEIIYGGQKYDHWHVIGLLICAKLDEGERIFALPHRAPQALSDIIKRKGGEVQHYTFSPSAISQNELTARKLASAQSWLTCGATIAAELMATLARRDTNILQLSAEMPSFEYLFDTFDIGESEKIAAIKCAGAPSGEGVIGEYDTGRVRVVARSGRGVSLYAEAANMEDAAELIKQAKKKIGEVTRGES